MLTPQLQKRILVTKEAMQEGCRKLQNCCRKFALLQFSGDGGASQNTYFSSEKLNKREIFCQQDQVLVRPSNRIPRNSGKFRIPHKKLIFEGDESGEGDNGYKGVEGNRGNIDVLIVISLVSLE